MLRGLNTKVFALQGKTGFSFSGDFKGSGNELSTGRKILRNIQFIPS
jgi:hypothetical protein